MLKAALRGESFFFTGGAGTGKSPRSCTRLLVLRLALRGHVLGCIRSHSAVFTGHCSIPSSRPDVGMFIPQASPSFSSRSSNSGLRYEGPKHEISKFFRDH